MSTNPTASQQYVINQGPVNPGDIQSLTVNETAGGIGTNATWHYKKVGKLYFNIYCDDHFGVIAPGADGSADFLDHFASLVGETCAAKYLVPMYTAGKFEWLNPNYTFADDINNGATPGVGFAFLAN